MTPSQVGDEVAKTLANVNKALEKATKEALRAVGKSARATLMKQAGVVPGGDRRFSNMSRYNHGGRLAVTFKVRPEGVFLGSKGPWKIAEAGAAPHGGHPGTARSQGRRSWTTGEVEALADAERDFPKMITDAVEGAFH